MTISLLQSALKVVHHDEFRRGILSLRNPGGYQGSALVKLVSLAIRGPPSL